ncbi:hypothetical protein J3F83DRAFT_48503 [Trichoderma novae-zelandiae]
MRGPRLHSQPASSPIFPFPLLLPSPSLPPNGAGIPPREGVRLAALIRPWPLFLFVFSLFLRDDMAATGMGDTSWNEELISEPGTDSPPPPQGIAFVPSFDDRTGQDRTRREDTASGRAVSEAQVDRWLTAHVLAALLGYAHWCFVPTDTHGVNTNRVAGSLIRSTLESHGLTPYSYEVRAQPTEYGVLTTSASTSKCHCYLRPLSLGNSRLAESFLSFQVSI